MQTELFIILNIIINTLLCVTFIHIALVLFSSFCNFFLFVREHYIV